MLHWGLLAAAHRLPFLPIRAGLGSDVLRVNPELRTVRSPYGGEELVAMPALRLDAALIHLNRADAAGNGQYLGPDPYFDDLFCLAAERAYLSCERIVPTAGLLESGPPQSLLVNRAMVARRGRDPGRRALHQLRAGLRPRRGVPGPVRGRRRRSGRLAAVPGRVPGRGRGQLPGGGPAVHREPARTRPSRRRRRERPGCRREPARGRPSREPAPGEPSRAEICVVACAEAWRGDGAILASPMGLIPTLGARLAQLTFAPGLLLSDGEATCSPRADARHRGLAALPLRVHDGGGGLRHVMMGAAQLDRYGNQNISCIGDWARPRAQLLGVRGAPGNTINHPVSYWVPRHSPRVFVERVDMVCGIGYDRAAGLGPQAARFHEVRVVVTNLAVLDFGAADHAMRLRSVHPGVRVSDVIAATGFPLVIPDEVPVTRRPGPDELALIRGVLDPAGRRDRELA